MAASAKLSADLCIFKVFLFMNPKLKRLIGSLLFALYLIFHITLVIALAYGILPGTSQAVQILYMAVAGTIWVIPGAMIIKWMNG